MKKEGSSERIFQEETLRTFDPAVLGIPAAARYIGVTRTSIYRMFWADEMPPVKLGHRQVVLKEDIDAYLQRNQQEMYEAV